MKRFHRYSIILGALVAWLGFCSPAYAQQTAPGICQVPKRAPTVICEVGAGFLCLNTPPGGIADESFLLKGTIDRQRSSVAAISIAVQHDYTKRTIFVETGDPAVSGCWDDAAIRKSFCIDQEGRFSARIPLSAFGPYTIAVEASRLSGKTDRSAVTLSRVTKLRMTQESLQFDPDIQKEKSTDAAAVRVTVDLLGECQFCDFIGAGTGGVTMTVENRISSADGEKRIPCSSTVSQEKQGRFIIGVPTGKGENALTITACNAASHGERCARVSGIAFRVEQKKQAFEIISPPPQASYDARAYPTIPFSFRLAGALGSCVDVHFNRGLVKACDDDRDGIFQTALVPRVGINIASVERGEDIFPWAFGWGRIASPFQGGAARSLVVKNGTGLWLSASMMTDIVQPFANHFLASDEFQEFLTTFVAKEDRPQIAAKNRELEGLVADLLPGCRAEAALGATALTLHEPPQLARARIDGISFQKNGMNVSLTVEDLLARLDLHQDRDRDGRGDDDPLPLVLALKRGVFDLSLMAREKNGKRYLVLTSPHTDCDYKSRLHCTGLPAPLLPKQLQGQATPFGHFAMCDIAHASPLNEELCASLNTLNAQTGIVSEKVLDALNRLLTCTTTAALAGVLGSDDVRSLTVGSLGGVLGPFELPLSMSLGEVVAFDSQGVALATDIGIGSSDFFAELPPWLRHESSGAIMQGTSSSAPSPGSYGGIGMSFSTDLLNALFFLLSTPPRGMLDIDLHELFFEKREVDGRPFRFAEQCGLEKPAAVCPIRPRVTELLGSPPVSYGYFAGDQPLLMRIRGNRALSPRISVAALDDIPVVKKPVQENVTAAEAASGDVPTGALVELELGGVMIQLYALKVDEAGQPDATGYRPLLRDAQGEPVIQSMLPDNPDPAKGQIISFELSLLLAAEVSQIEVNPLRPDAGSLRLRILADRSRLLMTSIRGSNTTTIPDESLGSVLRSKLELVLAKYSSKEQPLTIPIPMSFELTSPGVDSLFSLLGLREIDFRPDGLSLTLDPNANTIRIDAAPIIKQLLHRSGTEFQVSLPR